MGSNPASIFHYYYESKWINKLKKSDTRRARFANIFRFVDDLKVFNDGGEFGKSFREIYPPELELKKENDSNRKGSFFRSWFKIRDERFSISL